MESLSPSNPKKLLIVGAGGFIGGFIAREALKRGYDTWVTVRNSTSLEWLTNLPLKFIILDYDNPEQMAKALTDALPATERWDYIIYNLGATKCVNFADFNRINFIYLQTFVETLRSIGKLPAERFLYMSSLSALGPGDEHNYEPLTNHTIPMPNTRYGVSKIKAETFLQTCSDLPWTIFRPTGVYGPHERDYLMMIKSIDKHWDFGVGYRQQMLTFIYVDDLVDAMFDAITTEATLKKKYIIAEPQAYTQKQFRKIVSRQLGRRLVIPVRLPMWAVYIASTIAERIASLKGKASTLNRDKYRIMRQRNWNCDITDAIRDFGFNPRFTLQRGIAETVKAYLKEKEEKKKSKAGEGQEK